MGVTSIRLNKEVELPLEQLAEKLDRSKNYLINLAIKEFVAKQEMEKMRWRDTLQALDSIKSGKIINEVDVNNWLESWGSENETIAPGR